jgi:hypothetical protein
MAADSGRVNNKRAKLHVELLVSHWQSTKEGNNPEDLHSICLGQSRNVYLLPLKRICKFEFHGF